jgi:hypothetical protein
MHLLPRLEVTGKRPVRSVAIWPVRSIDCSCKDEVGVIIGTVGEGRTIGFGWGRSGLGGLYVLSLFVEMALDCCDGLREMLSN